MRPCLDEMKACSQIKSDSNAVSSLIILLSYVSNFKLTGATASFRQGLTTGSICITVNTVNYVVSVEKNSMKSQRKDAIRREDNY